MELSHYWWANSWELSLKVLENGAPASQKVWQKSLFVCIFLIFFFLNLDLKSSLVTEKHFRGQHNGRVNSTLRENLSFQPGKAEEVTCGLKNVEEIHIYFFLFSLLSLQEGSYFWQNWGHAGMWQRNPIFYPEHKGTHGGQRV